MSLPSAAKTPVRSVSAPRVMVLPSMPRPTLTPSWVVVAESEALVLQPEAASAIASDTSATAPRFEVLFMLVFLRVTSRLAPGWCAAPDRPRTSPPKQHRVHGWGAAGGARDRRVRRARRARRGR